MKYLKPLNPHIRYIIYNKNTGEVCNETLSKTASKARACIDYDKEKGEWGVKKIEFSININ